MWDRAMRQGVLAISGQPAVERYARTAPWMRRLVDRFVAGETVDDAITVVRAIATQGMTATLDHLGENVRTETAANAAGATYRDVLRRLAAAGLEPCISVKLTMLGLAFDDRVPESILMSILEDARAVGGFVRVDMEGSAYTERTLDMVERLHARFPEQVGGVIQAYLYRSPADIERLIARRIRVRLVKGAYAEPASIAYQRPRDIDAAYVRLMERLLDDGPYPAIATHDPALLRSARGYATRMGIGRDRFEFQMLYGVRCDEQRSLTADGYRMRVYVPFGTEWYPYFTRRIAERPANALFVLRQLLDRGEPAHR
ncbi:MAG TPA: proline dehydrogenase family protein [Thermomicrobiales bacterium]|nr:proline dehydrogenase family protein [Thermomicrobiales bacterium]